MALKSVKLRNAHWIMISILIVSAVILSAVSTRTASADGTTKVFIDPAQVIFTSSTVGQSFKVNVTVANVTNLAGIEFNLNWDPTLLSCFEIVENLYHTVTPPAEYENIWSIKLTKNNTGGYAIYAQTYQDLARAIDGGYAPINITTAEFPEGRLTIAMFTFNITQVPAANTYSSCNLTLLPVKLGDPQPVPIPATVVDGYYAIYGPPETISHSISYGGTTYTVKTVSNVSVVQDSVAFAKVGDNDYELKFNLTGADGSTGYVNVTIPKSLMSIGPSDQWNVVINAQQVTPTVASDATNWYLYITTSLSTKSVTIIGTIPEFTMLIIPVLMVISLIAVGIRRRKRM